MDYAMFYMQAYYKHKSGSEQRNFCHKACLWGHATLGGLFAEEDFGGQKAKNRMAF